MIQIDVQSILHNVRELRRILGPKVKLCCVVKGDGYGCGDVRMTRVLEQYADVDMVAVAVLDEARHLRDSGVTLPILVLCDIEDGDARDVVRYDLIPSIYRLEFARRLNAVAEGKRIPVHVRLDVCAGSPGMLGRDFLALLPELLAMPNLRLAGLYTQLYGAYIEERAEMDRQLDRFFGVVDALPEDLRRTLCIHAASTAAAMEEPRARLDMVRIGAALYGLPFGEGLSPFRPVMSIRSRIISLKTVCGEAFAGYHEAESGEAPRRLATVQGGYEDALFLMFLKGGAMLVRGRRAPIVGEACMDTTTIDVTDIPDAALDDEVVLLGRQGGEEITLGEIMQRAGFTLSNCQLAFKTGRRTPKQYVNYPERGAWRPLLRQAAQRSPALARALESGARWTLGEYAQRLADFPAGTPLQDPQDLPRAAAEVLAPALGPDAAREAAAALQGCALTANHHGVDCFAQSVQGNVLFREVLRRRGVAQRTLPVLACGSVPLDNSSYGKGLLLFDTLDGKYPLRVPVLPNRFNDSIVGLFPAISREQVERALERVSGEPYALRLSGEMRDAVRRVLRDFYGDAETLALPSYADQACRINLRMTQEALGAGYAYVDLEKTAARLLGKDAREADSLFGLLLRDKALRQEALSALDGAAGCWSRKALAGGNLAAGGTCFFWAVGERWTRSPLLDEGDALRNVRTRERLPYAAVPEALAQGRIYPGLFLSFLPLLFARDIRCFGGCFQPEYLRVMRDGLAAALGLAGYAALSKAVAGRDPSGYLSGPMFLEGRSGAPVGIVELLCRKPTKEEEKNWMNLNFEQAHRVALANLYPDIVPAAERAPDYLERLRRA